jgi:hypothetical protein
MYLCMSFSIKWFDDIYKTYLWKHVRSLLTNYEKGKIYMCIVIY